MGKWSHQYTLNTGLIVLGLLAILSSGASLFASKAMVQEMEALATGEVRDLSDTRALRLLGHKELSDGSAFLLTGEETYARAARAGSDAVRERSALLGKQIVDHVGRSLVARVLTTEGDYREAFERASRNPGAGPSTVTAAVGSRGRAFEQALDSLVAHMEPAVAGGLASTRASMERTQAVFNVVMAVSIVLALMLCGLLIVAINRNQRSQATALVVAEQDQNRISADLDAAKASNQLKDQFLATVSHELRNPLAPILTWAHLLRGGMLEKEKADRGLEVIERNVASLSQLIDDLVDVSRVVSGKFRLDVRPIDLVPAIRAAVESQRPAIDAKQIRLRLVLDERAGLVSGDSERLQQVMGNLLSNAIKFTAKHGSVQIVLARVESHVEVTMADSGIGMAPAFLPHIFEPFQQAAEGSTRRHGGLGLGLSIVRHIVELHGGEIGAASKGQGLGSTFTLKFPLLGVSQPAGSLRARHPGAVDGPSNVQLGRLDKVRVLLVDDEPNANEAVQALLDSCGAEVRVAGSAAQALQMLDVWKPDVLISDIAMPEEDGYVLIKKIRARGAEDSGNIPAAALTAYSTTDDRVNILAAGFHMYLAKPAEPGELIAVVASLAARRRREANGAAAPLLPPA